MCFSTASYGERTGRGINFERRRDSEERDANAEEWQRESKPCGVVDNNKNAKKIMAKHNGFRKHTENAR